MREGWVIRTPATSTGLSVLMRSPWRAAALAGAATMPPRRTGGHSTDHRRQVSSGLAALAGGGGLLCRALARSLFRRRFGLLGGLFCCWLLFRLFRCVLALGRRALLALDALLEQRHEVDHVRGGVGVRGLLFLQRGGDALALEPLLDHRGEPVAELVAVVLRLELAGHRLDQLACHLQFAITDAVVRDRLVRQRILLLAHQLLREAQQDQHQRLVL